MKTKKIEIIIAEDHVMVRRSLISLIEEQKDLNVTGEAGDGKQLLELLKKSNPDIILMDIEMPVMNGVETLKLVRKKHPNLNIIMLSMFDEITLMSECMSIGAKGFIPKCCSIEVLFEAIRKVYSEGYFFSDKISRALISDVQREKKINPVFKELALSDREIEILKHICEGKTNKEISKNLHITTSTVGFHRGNIYQKTKSNNIVELIKYSIRNGFVSIT